MVSQSLREPITTPTSTGFESAIALTPSKGVFYADIGKNSTVMDKKLLDILCCPASKQSLLLLSSDQLDRMNAAIAAGKAVQLDGQPVNKPLKEALITRDGKLIYRIDDGIPVLLAEEAVASASIDGLSV
ncbi:MAG: hypothetical protein RIS67_945 [Pseudomonadota bacterium]